MLRPPDVVVLFAAISARGSWTIRSLADRLGVPHAMVQRALTRLAETGVYDSDSRQAIPHAAEDFLEHALRYLHPIRLGTIVRGVPTAWGASPLREEIFSNGPPPVWPDPDGDVRGNAVEPLDSRLPALVRTWPAVAQLAALADAIRLGDAHTRAAAQRHLHARIYRPR